VVCCLYVIWEIQDQIWAKTFCIPKNLHSRTPMNTNIWELYWILSSQMTKTFRDNCDTNIVQQTSCEPLFPMFKCSKNVLFRSYCTPMHALQLWCNSRKSCVQRFRVDYNFGCRALYNLPWRASVKAGLHQTRSERKTKATRHFLARRRVSMERECYALGLCASRDLRENIHWG